MEIDLADVVQEAMAKIICEEIQHKPGVARAGITLSCPACDSIETVVTVAKCDELPDSLYKNAGLDSKSYVFEGRYVCKNCKRINTATLTVSSFCVKNIIEQLGGR